MTAEQLLHDISLALRDRDTTRAVGLMVDLTVDYPAQAKALAVLIKRENPQLSQAVIAELAASAAR